MNGDGHHNGDGDAGVLLRNLDDPRENMVPLFETIIEHIPAPEGDPEAPTQVLISTIDYMSVIKLSASIVR